MISIITVGMNHRNYLEALYGAYANIRLPIQDVRIRLRLASM